MPIDVQPKDGIKYDTAKPDFSLVPPHALLDLARVLTYGAEKYDRENWKKLHDLENRYFAACQRHLWADKSGESVDPESGISHLAHALASIMFIIEHRYLKSKSDQNETK